jgi:hypothetical protein
VELLEKKGVRILNFYDTLFSGTFPHLETSGAFPHLEHSREDFVFPSKKRFKLMVQKGYQKRFLSGSKN